MLGELNMSKKQNLNRIQSRNWDITTYVSENCIIQSLNEHRDIIRAYAYILHDKFTLAELGDKESKQSHFHIVLRLYRPLNLTTVINWFREFNDDGSRINSRAIVMHDVVDRFEYLIHKNDPDKWQFPFSEIKGYNIQAFKSVRNCDDDSAVDALNDLLSGCSVYDVCTRYGRDVIYHFPQLKFCFDLIYYGKDFEEVKSKNELLNRNRTLQGCNHPFVDVEHIENFK